MSTYIIKTTDGHRFEVDTDQLNELDVIENKDGSFHLIFENRSFTVEILEEDHLNKSYLLNINDKEIALQLMDELDVKIEKMGYSAKAASSGGKIFSPMPGLVLRIEQNIGSRIVAGDTLLILEAMKMENVIKSTGEGTVKAIYVTEGETVAKKQLLIELE